VCTSKKGFCGKQLAQPTLARRSTVFDKKGFKHRSRDQQQTKAAIVFTSNLNAFHLTQNLGREMLPCFRKV
jgi:hypothetical protein